TILHGRRVRMPSARITTTPENHRLPAVRRPDATLERAKRLHPRRHAHVLRAQRQDRLKRRGRQAQRPAIRPAVHQMIYECVMGAEMIPAATVRMVMVIQAATAEVWRVGVSEPHFSPSWTGRESVRVTSGIAPILGVCRSRPD